MKARYQNYANGKIEQGNCWQRAAREKALEKTGFENIWLVACLILFYFGPFPVACCQAKGMPAMEMKELKIDSRITLYHPLSLFISKKSPTEDFDIYYFGMKGAIILSLYVGNHPKIGAFEDSTSQVEYIEDIKIECHELKDKKERYGNECLVDLRKLFDFPQYLHFWYDVDKQEQKDVADGIIHSLVIE